MYTLISNNPKAKRVLGHCRKRFFKNHLELFRSNFRFLRMLFELNKTTAHHFCRFFCVFLLTKVG